MRALVAFVVLAASVHAQEAWDAETLDPQKLKTALEEAKGRAADAAAAARVALLEELIRTLEDRTGFMTPAEIGRRQLAAQAALDALRQEPRAETVAIDAERDLPQLERRFQLADAERSTATKALDYLVARRKAAEDEAPKLTARGVEAARQLVGAQEKTGAAADYLKANARLHVRVVAERDSFLKEAVARWAKRLPMQQLEADLAQVRFMRAQVLLKRAQTAVALTRDEEARRARARAEADLKAAESATDPIQRFRLRTRARTALRRADTKAREGVLLKLAQDLEREKAAVTRLEDERERLARRLALREDVSGRTAELLVAALERIRRSRDLLERRTLPALYGEIAANQSELVSVLDELWDLHLRGEENPAYAQLVAAAPNRRDEIRQAFIEEIAGQHGQLAALREYKTVLESIESRYGELVELLGARRDALDRQMVFVLSRIYWVRSDPPLSADVFRGAWNEVKGLGGTYADRDVRRGVWDSFRASRVVFLLGVVGMLLLAVLAVYLGPKLRRRCEVDSDRPRWVQVLAGVGAASFLPAVLLLAAALVAMLALPRALAVPATRGLLLLAAFWFPRRLAQRFLCPDGLAVKTGQIAADVAAQLLRSVRLATTAGIVFYVPYAMLGGDPLLLQHLPRLLFTVFLALLALALILLLSRNGPVIVLWTGRKGLVYRVWGIVGTLLSVLLVGIVVMDVLGYRVGASHLMANAVQTLVAALLLAWLYSLLGRAVDRIASAVRMRTAKEEGWQAARASSTAVVAQLSRVVSMLVIVVAAVLLLDFWGADEGIRDFLSGIHLTQVDATTYLTAWNVAVALLWIAGAHFLVFNLSGLYEYVVFPFLGGSDRGGQYVLLALSRYVILLVAYSAAVLSLHFSFASLGWLLAAASVGLGFGLQEIVANFVSGLILLFERPIRVGDIITVGETAGVVERINIRATHVTNWDRQQIVVPNKNFITQNLTNWTRNDQVMRRRVLVGVEYGSDVEKVLRILDEIVKQHPAVLADPEPRIWFEAFGESSLDFEIWFFCPIDAGKMTMSEVRTQIHQRFADEGITIPFPQRDLHVRSIDDGIAGLLDERRRS